MDTTRRALLTGSVTAAALAAGPAWGAAANTPRVAPLGAFGIEAGSVGLKPGPDDQSQALTRALKLASSRNAPLVLPPGEFRVGNVTLPEDCRIIGVPGATRLVHAGQGSMLIGHDAKRVSLTGLVLDGSKRAMMGREGLVTLEDVADLTVVDCAILDVAGVGLSLTRATGRISQSRFAGIADTALVSLDAKGLAIIDNVVERCGNNGIQVWRSAKGDDATIVRGNRISAVRAEAGGSGQYGNGINIFRAANVMVSGNQISGCAFSAIRGNAASNLQALGNICTALGEVALYAEFGFEGAVIANNTIDGAAFGIAVTNFNEGGRLAVVQGNLIRNVTSLRPAGTDPNDGFGVGIGVEADTAVTGNTIENAPVAGMAIGFGSFLRNVAATGNVLRKVGVGVAVSVSARAGTALIANNLIAEAKGGAIVGMDHHRVVTGDLTKPNAERLAHIRVGDNLIQ
jgi:uncharacterized secreted repeat protein (TIGR03808 family)